MTGATLQRGGLWDAIVVGAGPAGSIAARSLALRGRRVLLADKCSFPRPKVCGCCLNPRAISVLDRLGLTHILDDVGAPRLQRLNLISAAGTFATIPLPGGRAISRDRLDTALIHAAHWAGASFSAGLAAIVGPCAGNTRSVSIGGVMHLARVVIVADGLTGTSLREVPGFEPRIFRCSRIGVGGIIDVPNSHFPDQAITMICSGRAYVGAVRLEDGRVDLAAAIDPAAVRDSGSPAAAIGEVLGRAGVEADIPSIWRGTGFLSRRRRQYAERLLVVGDAAGYVEPFTGEGMAWAMAGGEAAAGFADANLLSASQGRAQSWEKVYRSTIGRQQVACRAITRLLRQPLLTAAAIRILREAPSLAEPIVRRINRDRFTAPRLST